MITQHELNEFRRITGGYHPADRARPGFQEQKNDRSRKTNNTTKGAKVDAKGRGGFVLSVEVLVSDRRRRDLDGALATICDVIVAVGRQLERDTEDHGRSENGKQRRGRGHNKPN